MDINDIIKPENLVYEKTKVLTDTTMHYCPGCSHGVVHRLIAEIVENLDIQEKTIAVAPVGCSVFAYKYIHVDWQEAAHGRAPAVATGIARTNPDKVVMCYQGDGDLASIGTAEIMHACNRGENIVVVFINNGIYGMTGGQMAPTTLVGQVTSTTPCGRDIDRNGYPLKITELIAQLPGTAYVTRQSVHTPGNIRKTRKAITKAFEIAMAKKGTAFVEVVSTCNMGWKMTPVKANEWMENNMFPFYPLGDMKDGEKADPESYKQN
ncbi:thiamine pyrophosphate-dependent enzyme [Sunxiuqinia sp. A32]|uniref:thiamine pyrophosphate-dependent enzyme n=1 Tax=Sunxiuqinia sp. A32 TaxID=3461496 RepID=UPI0040458EB1